MLLDFKTPHSSKMGYKTIGLISPAADDSSIQSFL